MKKIVFVLLALALVFLVSCTNDEANNTQDLSEVQEDLGYVDNLDDELDTSDMDSLDEDLNLDWV